MGRMRWDDKARHDKLRRRDDVDDQYKRLSRAGKTFQARYNGTSCAVCRQPIYRNEWMRRYLDGWAHRSCTQPR